MWTCAVAVLVLTSYIALVDGASNGNGTDNTTTETPPMDSTAADVPPTPPKVPQTKLPAKPTATTEGMKMYVIILIVVGAVLGLVVLVGVGAFIMGKLSAKEPGEQSVTVVAPLNQLQPAAAGISYPSAT